MDERYRLKLESITPVHIGTGDTLYPTDYIVLYGILYHLNPIEIVRYLLQKYPKEFPGIVDSRNMNRITKYFYQHFNPDIKETWISRFPVNKEYDQQYQQQIYKPENQNLLHPFIRGQWQAQPYIPGSSVKGAMRTAILNALCVTKNIPLPKKPGKNANDGQIQSKILGVTNNIVGNDPFKYLKISDLPFESDFLDVMKMVNSKPQPRTQSRQTHHNRRGHNKAGGIPSWHEVLKPSGSSCIIGSMTVSPGFFSKIGMNMTDVISAVNNYSKSGHDSDLGFFSDMGQEPIWQEIKNQITDIPDNQMAIRIGKGTGRHFKMYQSVRKTPGTRNLFEGYPPGWCICSLERLN